MIKYLGSKRLLLPRIVRITTALPHARSAIDLFSGTSRVGHALKGAGLAVQANDHNAYAATLARCYVQADRDDLLSRAEALLAELNALPGEPGYFTQTFCVEARFFQPDNGARVDAIRDRIEALDLEPELRAVALVSLMEAADRVDSTTGVQMAYLKQWARRSQNRLTLRMPDVLPQATAGKGMAHQLDALQAARALSADVGYVDPPYNQHKYLGNYHIWETLVRWDAPEAYGKARKRVDCRERKSAFNSKPGIAPAIEQVIDALDVRHLIVSFSNEGFVDRDHMVQMLSKRGEVFVLEQDYPRHVGARIGIYSPQGKKVGRVSHTKNKEFLFVVPEHADDLRGLA